MGLSEWRLFWKKCCPSWCLSIHQGTVALHLLSSSYSNIRPFPSALYKLLRVNTIIAHSTAGPVPVCHSIYEAVFFYWSQSTLGYNYYSALPTDSCYWRIRHCQVVTRKCCSWGCKYHFTPCKGAHFERLEPPEPIDKLAIKLEINISCPLSQHASC